jgi:broad-specificity NMP kinase
VKRILVTGMSGTGKSSLLGALQQRGFECVEADTDAWCELEDATNETAPQAGWVWLEDAIAALLQRERTGPLFVSGCVSNQGKFYPLFDQIVLLSAPLEVMLERIATRSNNAYGKSAAERAEILGNLEFVEPLLRAGCDIEFDTSKFSVQQLADELVELVH